ncbi:MAG: alkaline phosphatase family protein [Actinomycetota bacterium]
MINLLAVTTGGPIVPDYSGPNLRGIIPALLSPPGGGPMPAWIPDPVAESDAVVLLVLDGLGWDQFTAHRAYMPTLSSFTGGSIQSVTPTTTATALTSITTGLPPSEHGILGYRFALGSEVINALRWMVGDTGVRRSHPPRDVQPFPPFLGHAVPVVSPAELHPSAFSEAHQRGCTPVGYRSPSSIAVEAADQLGRGERLVYCYYGGIDKIAHERGFGPFYEAELRFADQIVAEILAVLPSGASLLVTADHGQVDVGERVLHPSEAMLDHVVLQSGEGRFRWLHARRGAVASLVEAGSDEFGDVAWVVTREQVLDEHWYGPAMAAPVAARLGDVAIVAQAPVSFYEKADSGPFELVCRHGSLTSAEINVPLLAKAG